MPTEGASSRQRWSAPSERYPGRTAPFRALVGPEHRRRGVSRLSLIMLRVRTRVDHGLSILPVALRTRNRRSAAKLAASDLTAESTLRKNGSRRRFRDPFRNLAGLAGTSSRWGPEVL